MGEGKKGIRDAEGTQEGAGVCVGGAAKRKSSKEGEITDGQSNQKNHLRIIAFWRLDEDLYFV